MGGQSIVGPPTENLGGGAMTLVSTGSGPHAFDNWEYLMNIWTWLIKWLNTVIVLKLSYEIHLMNSQFNLMKKQLWTILFVSYLQ